MNKIKILRKKKNMTQEQLAKEMEVRQSTVSDWETGKISPTAHKLQKLAKVLGCRIDDLF